MATRLFNGLVLVVVGAILLMNTTGYLPWSVWESTLRFWPVILVGFGLQLLAGKRFPGLALAVVAILILAAMNPYAGESLSWRRGSKVWDLEMEPATSKLDISLNAPSLELDIRGDSSLNARDPALAASFDLSWDRVEPGTSSRSLSDTLRATVEPNANPSRSGRQEWSLALNPSLATSLTVGGGVSNLRADLSAASVDSINIQSGVAKVDLTLGLAGRDTTVNVTGGVGNVRLDVPEAAGLKITLTGPLAFVSDFADQGLTKSGNTWSTPDFDSKTTKIILCMTCGAGKVDLNR
ncbi:MAG: LiaI-LiaF-like domain-containing protein [Bacillota bacterium]